VHLEGAAGRLRGLRHGDVGCNEHALARVASRASLVRARLQGPRSAVRLDLFVLPSGLHRDSIGSAVFRL